MTWFFIALIAPLLWSLTNHTDKFLLSKYTEGDEGVGALIIYSSLFSIILFPVIIFIQPDVLNILVKDALVLIGTGALSVIAILLYLKAIDKDEASTVVPFFQLVPVWGYILGYLILGEILAKNQLIAGVCIVFGAFLLSLEFNIESKTKIKKGVLALMVGSSLIYAFYEVIFKLIAVEQNFWISMFWEVLGTVFAGLFILVFVKKYRKDFFKFLRHHNKAIFSLNILNESMTVIGGFLYNFALLLAPVVMVMLVNSYQPVFVFIEGLLLTLFFPKIATEKITAGHLLQKIVAIGIIFVGSIILYI